LAGDLLELLAWLYSETGQTISGNRFRIISHSFWDIRDNVYIQANLIVFERGIPSMQMQELSLVELLAIILIFAFYFLPTLIAFLRQRRNKLAIFLLNLFLGWTVLGWVVSLVCSVMR
jgi:Superinfection immunity protein